ncbi:MAG: hypothetical protein ACXU8U_01755 [Asticcacaulis sp.]
MERLHKVSAAIVFAFLCLHFANHLIGLEGLDAHRQFMDAARLVYRHPVVEMAVALAFVIRIITGMALSRTIWRERKDWVHQLQALSGTVLMVFILMHAASLAYARMVLNLDTDFYFAAATLKAPGWLYLFYGLYGLGVFALFVHMGCIAYDIFKKTNKPVGYAFLAGITGLGGYVTWLLLLMYSGHLYGVTLPDAYTGMFSGRPSAVAAPPGSER